MQLGRLLTLDYSPDGHGANGVRLGQFRHGLAGTMPLDQFRSVTGASLCGRANLTPLAVARFLPSPASIDEGRKYLHIRILTLSRSCG